MGSGASSKKKKNEPLIRKAPLSTSQDVLNNAEAKDKLKVAMSSNKPGTSNRWEKILHMLNKEIPPTEKFPDPLRVELNLIEMKAILRRQYDELKSINSIGLSLQRQYLPKLFDKHSLDRGKRVSEKEREARRITNECFAYGELDPDIFATIFLKVASVYGMKNSGIFYDLGCGVGQLVYAAAFIGNFKSVNGIEYLKTLIQRGEKRGVRWESMKYQIKNEEITATEFNWIEDDFQFADFWTDGSFFLLHWTAFSKTQRELVSKIMSSCAEGTHVVSFTYPIPGDDFEILVEDNCETSWGNGTFYFQEKITTANQRNGG